MSIHVFNSSLLGVNQSEDNISIYVYIQRIYFVLHTVIAFMVTFFKMCFKKNVLYHLIVFIIIFIVIVLCWKIFLKPVSDEEELFKIKQLEVKTWAKSIIKGYYKPPKKVKHKFAVIIPFRDRIPHLRIFLEKMHPYFQNQSAEYQIFVIEQENRNLFNKASLMNAGYILSKNLAKVPFDCFIFHDIDTFPISNNVIYKCLDIPYHLGARIKEFKFRLLFEIVGAVFAVTAEQFERLNGFSNMYEGWGGEDTDMYYRVLTEYKTVGRPSKDERFYLLRHSRDTGNPVNKKRFWYNDHVRKRYKQDGLNTLKFKVQHLKNYTNLATWVTIDMPRPDFRDYLEYKARKRRRKKRLKRKRH